MTEVTQILSQIELGDPSAAEQLLPLVYEELRRLATAKLVQEKPGQTLQATALVHEAYVRLVQGDKARCWESRGHFFAAAAVAMRRILVDAARQKRSQRRGGGLQRRGLLEGDAQTIAVDDQLLDLDEALSRLEQRDAQAAEVVRLRFFAGMTFDELARHMGVSARTAKRNWAFARAWLGREMASSDQRET
jgi:RNA polymerase sigma factor (TIGR02999 family)